LVYTFFTESGAQGDSIFVVGNTRQSYFFPHSQTGQSNQHTASIHKLASIGGTEFISTSFGDRLDLSTGLITPPTTAYSTQISFDSSSSVVQNTIVSDFNGDGEVETASSSTIYGSLTDGNLPSSIHLAGGDFYTSSCDVDGDGRNDLLLSDAGGITVLNYALASVDNYPTEMANGYSLAAHFPGSKQDAVFVVGTDRLSQLTTKAQQANGFPIPLPHHASVVLFPVGTANKTLGVATIGSDGVITLFDTHNNVDANSFIWRSKYADERNSNFAASKGNTSAPTSEFFPDARCYNWPNPTYESITKIRYYVSDNATVTVKIYDLAGDKVDELKSSAVGGTDNEMDWDVSKIQSGVYLAHISAVAGGKSGTKIIKIAVVK